MRSKDYDARIKKALQQIKFIERYKGLSEKYNVKNHTDEELLLYFDGYEVLDMLRNKGYKPGFNRKERFFYIKKEERENLTYSALFTLHGGGIGMQWRIYEGKKLVFEESCGWISKSFLGEEYVITQPVFCDYEELEDILKSCFELYEDFKKAMAES